jgi:hypothetical protein
MKTTLLLFLSLLCACSNPQVLPDEAPLGEKSELVFVGDSKMAGYNGLTGHDDTATAPAARSRKLFDHRH